MEEIDNLLNVANLVVPTNLSVDGPPMKPQERSGRLSWWDGWLAQKGALDEWPHIQRAWIDHLAGFPSLRTYLGTTESDLSDTQYQRLVYRFNEFNFVRNLVSEIVDHNERMSGPHLLAVAPGVDPRNIETRISLPYISTLLLIGDKSEIRNHWAVNILLGRDTTKLSRCSRPDCRKYFWQQRKDKRTCSRRCSNFVSQVTYRKSIERS